MKDYKETLQQVATAYKLVATTQWYIEEVNTVTRDGDDDLDGRP